MRFSHECLLHDLPTPPTHTYLIPLTPPLPGSFGRKQTSFEPINHLRSVWVTMWAVGGGNEIVVWGDDEESGAFVFFRFFCREMRGKRF